MYCSTLKMYHAIAIMPEEYTPKDGNQDWGKLSEMIDQLFYGLVPDIYWLVFYKLLAFFRALPRRYVDIAYFIHIYILAIF